MENFSFCAVRNPQHGLGIHLKVLKINLIALLKTHTGSLVTKSSLCPYPQICYLSTEKSTDFSLKKA